MDQDSFFAPMYGPLQKFTNVMQGWQMRSFELDPTVGELRYYLKPDHVRQGKVRGYVLLLGATIVPSEEESLSFTVQPLQGDAIKLRASNVKEKQDWINHLRACAENLRELRMKRALATAAAQSPDARTLSAVSSIYSVRKLISLAADQHRALCNQSDAFLASEERTKNCELTKEVLLTKSLAQSLMATMSDLKEDLVALYGAPSNAENPRSTHASTSSRVLHPLAQPPRERRHHPTTSAELGEDVSTGIEVASEVQSEAPSQVEHSTFYVNSGIQSDRAEKRTTKAERLATDSATLFAECTRPADQPHNEPNLATLAEHKAAILTTLADFKMGTDLCKSRLPSFCLAPRSLLETYADAFARAPKPLCAIEKCSSDVRRMLLVVQWYLSLFEPATRRGKMRKPLNPVLGEQYRCVWKEEKSDEAVNVLVEQTSHTPPTSRVTAYSAKGNARVHFTAAPHCQFMGFNMQASFGEAGAVTIGDEEYTFELPTAYARSIVSTPWFELVGRVRMHCASTKLTTRIQFHAKPMYEGRTHTVNGTIIRDEEDEHIEEGTFRGHWDEEVEFQLKNNDKVTCSFRGESTQKFIPPQDKQVEMESGRVWAQVVDALRRNDLNAAESQRNVVERRYNKHDDDEHL